MTQGGKKAGREAEEREGGKGGDPPKKNAKKMILSPSAPLLALLLIASGSIFGGTHTEVVSIDHAWALTKIWAPLGGLQGEIQKLVLKSGFQNHDRISKPI